MRITMVGTGYVGLVTGACLADTGNDVTCLDIDEAKINKLNQGGVPIYEPGLNEIVRRNVKGRRLHFTADKQAAYQRAEAIFICVGTPSDIDGHADLRFVLAAAADVGQAMQQAPGATGGEADERRAKVVIVKSTVPVGTNQRVREAIAKHTDKLFHMAANPEFLKEGAAINDFMKPDRVVIGCDDKGAGERLRDLYEPYVRQGNPIFVMDIASAEMVKYAANAMLATKISFINEVANLCEAYGADIDAVRRGMCTDGRIGNQFFYPGLGYGGSCFPKDVLACISMGTLANAPTALLSAVHQVNQKQREAFIAKFDRHFTGASSPAERADLAGKRIAVWGVAFKPGTDDVREAPSLTIINALLDRGAEIVVYDPVAMETGRAVLGGRVRYAENQLDAIDGADALTICTEWSEFKFPDFDEMKARLKTPVIFDGRNLYRRKMMNQYGFVYYCVGREPVIPQAVSSP